jgi:hypothetical protein
MTAKDGSKRNTEIGWALFRIRRLEQALLMTDIAANREKQAIVEENVRLRAALAMSDQPCVYCSLSKEDWGKCANGFPGCDRGDDAMGCPELGAAMRLAELQRRLKKSWDEIGGALDT